jgi:hypothetical protein
MNIASDGSRSTVPVSLVQSPMNSASPAALAESRSLLPMPQLGSGDPLASLLALETASRGIGLNTAIKDINHIRMQKADEWKKQKADLQKAMSAHKKGGFWRKVGKICGTIAKVAAVVASIAVAACSGGAGAPLVLAVAAACLSTAAFAQSEAHILEKLGVSEKVAGWAEFGMTIGSVVCTGGASLCGSGAALTAVQHGVQVGGEVVAVGGGVAAVGQGVSIYEQGQADAAEVDAYADIAKSKLVDSHLDQLLLTILDELDQNEKSFRRAVSNVKGATESAGATLVLAAGRV